MLIPVNTILEKKETFIFIFIQKISSKNMQDLIFFLHQNHFHIKRITRKNNKKVLTSIFVNANFILKSEQNICSQQLKNTIDFLKQHTKINGIIFKNQVLNFERISKIEQQSLFNLWKQISQIRI